MWVSAEAMFSVPSVTMKAGSRMRVTSMPLPMPKAVQTAIPSRIARYGLTPLATASFVMTMVSKAITKPFERSMPAVSMTSVSPIASTPTSIDCWTISEKLSPVMNWSDFSEKKTQAASRASSGPKIDVPTTRDSADCPWPPLTGGSLAARRAARARPGRWVITAPTCGKGAGGGRAGGWAGRGTGGRGRPPRPPASLGGSAPAVGEAEGHVLGRDAGHRLARDQVHAGVDVAGRLLAGLRVLDDGAHAQARHLERVLLRGGGDLAGLDALDAGAAAVDRDDQHLAG